MKGMYIHLLCFMNVNKPFVITLVGAESSGKTTIAEELSRACNCPVLHEYAREYLSALNRPYELGDLKKIALHEWSGLQAIIQEGSSPFDINTSIDPVLQEKFRWIFSRVDLNGRQILIVDGGMLTIKLWAHIRFGKEIDFVEGALAEDPTDLYLLVRPLHKWEFDVLRESPDLVDRVWIYQQYLKELQKNEKEFFIVSGAG